MHCWYPTRWLVLISSLFTVYVCALVNAQTVDKPSTDTGNATVVPAPTPTPAPVQAFPLYTDSPGDRVVSKVKDLAGWIPSMLSRENYRISPGDTLAINVQGRSSWKYEPNPSVEGVDPREVVVSPAGDLYLPLVGRIQAAGKTLSEIEEEIRIGLSKFFKHFEVTVALSKIRTINVWVSGEVENPGPLILPAVSTVSLAVLQAGIKPTGSTRRITLIRDGERHVVDLYKMTVTGNLDSDVPLEAGDAIHVPPVNNYVKIEGEVVRPGKYELTSDSLTVKDLVDLALGTTPAAALEKAFIERIGENGLTYSINVNLRGELSEAANITLKAGDKLVVPSIEAFQPMVRLVGEFKGIGIYQRTPGSTAADIENKSGVYYLKQGQTVLDVVTAVGGVTPQANLRRARVERRVGNRIEVIPVDLDRLINQGDKSADVALVNGDVIVIPAVTDKVHVFGEVRQAGSFVFSPSRRLIDYIGEAKGPTPRARLTEVSVVRVIDNTPHVFRFNVKKAMSGGSAKDNPELEPGDIVYVPSKFVSDWRDAMQVMFTGLSLMNLLER
jgi:protein involved in polysaccharide export with SLBB domain